MPAFVFSEYVWLTLACQLATSILTAMVLLPLCWKRGGQLRHYDAFGILVALSLIGVVTGYMTGLSRAPVVGAVLPSVLTIVSGLVLFLVTRDVSSELRILTAASTIALMINLVLGTSWGSLSREDPNRLSAYAVNQELIRQQICYKRLAFELEARQARIKEGLQDVNPTSAVPGCTPPFDTKSYDPAAESDLSP